MNLLPLAAAAVCLLAFVLWRAIEAPLPEDLRMPVEWDRPEPEFLENAANPGTLIPGVGKPSMLPGSWPQFRGAGRDNIVTVSKPLARTWPPEGPPVLWRIPLGDGYAGAAILNGRLYLVDYDLEKQEDAIRCLSLDDAREIWRYTYSVTVKRNHGMSRTVPAVNDRYVVAIGPMSHVTCLDAESGELVWKKDLVREHGTKTPMWYAGQCPLIEDDRVILAPGGEPLMMAVDLATGESIWETPGEEGLGMTHSSIVPMTFNGRRQYIYCATGGVVGVDAEDGRIVWRHPDWKIKIANIPSPIPVGEDRIFLSGGYDTGCAMVRLIDQDGAIAVEEIFRLEAPVFGSDQQTPILHKGHIYGVVPRGELVCLDLDGNRVWDSGVETRFELGPYLIADGLIFVLDGKKGALRLAEAVSTRYMQLAEANLFTSPHEVWGPMTLVEGRLILRDMTEMICIDVGGQ
jgi:outer membrane protein assembly factor BamB